MTNEILILLSSLVLFSYLFDLLSKKTRIPSVLLLMALGFSLQQITRNFGIEVPFLDKLLPTLGTIGLIMIVFEGALDLHFTPNKKRVVRNSLLSALFNLIGSCLIIGSFIHYYSGAGYYDSFFNAIPFAVVSSAIAIPSVATLDTARKEFIIYESTFSDILGIMLFNFFLVNREVTGMSFVHFTIDFAVTLLIAGVFSLLMVFMMGKIRHHIKFFLIISMLILIYASGKMFHLSSLIIVLGFGLFLKNAHQMPIESIKRRILYGHYQQDFEQLHQLSAESAFLIRTFFFIIFGFMINADLLSDFATIENGIFIIAFIFLFRTLYSIVTTRKLPIPEVLINPRGLITILLFYSLPADCRLPMVNEGLLFVVILGTSLVMTSGMMLSGLGKK